MDKTANVVLDIEGLPQPPDKCCSGSPKMTVCHLVTQKVLKDESHLQLLSPYFSAEGPVT